MNIFDDVSLHKVKGSLFLCLWDFFQYCPQYWKRSVLGLASCVWEWD